MCIRDSLEDMHNFKDEVAASRTFVFVREIEPLLSAGLIKGGEKANKLAMYFDEADKKENIDNSLSLIHI